MLARAPHALYYFEPCGRPINKEGQPGGWFRYLRPGQSDEQVEQACDAAFGGLPFPDRRWQRGAWRRLVPGYRIVVKDVATLMATEWVAQRYRPHVLVVVRHPCAVVLSALRQGIVAEPYMAALHRNVELRQDYLNRYHDVIRTAATPVQVLGAIWAVCHRVLGDGLSRHADWAVVNYEALCAEPVGEFRAIFSLLGLHWNRAVEEYVIRSSSRHVPGLYSGVRVSSQQIGKWRTEIEKSDLEVIRHYVRAFDLPFYRSDEDWP